MALSQPKEINWTESDNSRIGLKGTTGEMTDLQLGFIIRPRGNKFDLEVKLKGYHGEPLVRNLTLIGAKRKANTILKEHITSLRVQLRRLTNTI